MKRLAVMLILGLFSFNSFAKVAETVTYYWGQCAFGIGQVDCNNLRNDLSSNETIEEIESEETADFKISFVDQETDNFNYYIITFEAKEKDQRPAVNKRYYVEATKDMDEPFIIKNIVDEIVRDASKLRVDDGTGDGGDKKEKIFYYQPRLNGQLSSFQGTTNSVISLNNNFNWSTDKWRVKAGIGGAHIVVKTAASPFSPGGRLRNDIVGAGAGYIRSLKNNHWSVMGRVDQMVADFEYEFDDPAMNDSLPTLGLANTAYMTKVSAGVEWIKQPFIEDNSGNVAIRYTLANEYHKYVDPEIFEYVKKNYVVSTIQLGLSQYYDNVTLEGTLTAFTAMNTFAYSGIALTAKPSFTIKKRLVISPSITFDYFNGRIPSQAANENQSFLSFTGAANNSISVTGNLGVTLTIGNSAKNRSDRRWE